MPARCNPRRLKKYSAVDAPARAHCFAVRAYGRRGGAARARGRRGRRRGRPRRPGDHDRRPAAPRRPARAARCSCPRARSPPKVPPTVSNPPSPQEVVQQRIDAAQAALDRAGRRHPGPVHAGAVPARHDLGHPHLDGHLRHQGRRGRCACRWRGRPASSTAGCPTSAARCAAPASIKPGLLAEHRSRAAAPTSGFNRTRDFEEAAAAADEQGTVRRVSMGPAATVGFRAQQLLERHRFVVVSLPAEAPRRRADGPAAAPSRARTS